MPPLEGMWHGVSRDGEVVSSLPHNRHLSVSFADSSPQGEPSPMPPLEGMWHGVSRDGEVVSSLPHNRHLSVSFADSSPQGEPSPCLPLRGGGMAQP